MQTALIVCGVVFVVCLAGDLTLRWVHFRRADEKTERFVNKFRYRGW